MSGPLVGRHSELQALTHGAHEFHDQITIPGWRQPLDHEFQNNDCMANDVELRNEQGLRGVRDVACSLSQHLRRRALKLSRRKGDDVRHRRYPHRKAGVRHSRGARGREEAAEPPT